MKTRRKSTTISRLADLGLASCLFMMTDAHGQDLDPTLRGTWTPPPPGYASGVAVKDGFAFVAVGRSGLAIIDVSNPGNPRRVGGYDTTGFAGGGVAVVGQFAYVADGPGGLQVIDVSDPTSPQLLGGSATGQEQWGAWNVAVSGDYAYLAGMEAGLQVIDVSDPANPKRLGNYQTSGNAIDVAVSGQFAYVASSGLEVVDVSDPDNPRRVGWANPISGETWGVDVVGQHAFVAGEGGLYIIDISDPTNPRRVGRYTTRGCSAVAVAGNRAYLADWYGRLLVIDVNDPAEPRRIGAYYTGGNPGVAVSGNFAYLAGVGGGLQVVDVSKPANVERIGGLQPAGAPASGVAVSDSHAYVVNTDFSQPASLHIIDVSAPANPHRVGGHDTNGIFYGLAISDRFAYVGLGSVGPAVITIDVSDSANPKEVSRYQVAGTPNSLVVSNHVAYLASGSAGLHILDVSDPASPQRVGVYSTIADCMGVAVSGQFAYVVGTWLDSQQGLTRGRLEAIDVSNAANPRRIGSYDTVGWAQGVAVSGLIACVADGRAGLQVLDVSDPTNLRRVGGYDINGWARNVAVLGNLAYVASEDTGLHLIDVRDPAHPQRVGGNSAFDANAVFVHRDIVYVAAGSDGLIILNKYTELRIGKAIVAGDGQLRLRLSGATGQRVRVQRSTNLKDWEDWQTATLVDSTTDLRDDIATGLHRFYRAIADNSEAVE